MISSIVLAAGQSRRMGRPKALLDWGGQPLLEYQVRQLFEAGCDEVIVVLGAQADLIHRQIRRLRSRVMYNPAYIAGRAGSLRIGARAVSRDADAIVIMNVDQPRPAELIRNLIAAHTSDAVATIPSSGGKHGHPVVVSGSLREELLAASDEDEGLRGILHAHSDRITYVEADDTALLDINTPGEYDAARERLGVIAGNA